MIKCNLRMFYLKMQNLTSQSKESFHKDTTLAVYASANRKSVCACPFPFDRKGRGGQFPAYDAMHLSQFHSLGRSLLQ